jgi:hypothetical protein
MLLFKRESVVWDWVLRLAERLVEYLRRKREGFSLSFL